MSKVINLFSREVRDTARESHPIRLECLGMTIKKADALLDIFREVFEGLGYSADRISPIDCRPFSGFIPYSHNMGGLEAVAYRGQYHCDENTGFENTDKVLESGAEYDLECFCEQNKIDNQDKVWSDDSIRDDFYEYRASGDDTVQFQVRFMVVGDNEIRLDCYISASDSPYHRKSDDRLELDINYKSLPDLRKKLETIIKNTHKDFFATLKQNIREAW